MQSFMACTIDMQSINQSINHLFLSWLIDCWLIALSRVLWRLGTCPTGKMCKDVDGEYNCLWYCISFYCSIVSYCMLIIFDLNNSNNYIVFSIFMFLGYAICCSCSLVPSLQFRFFFGVVSGVFGWFRSWWIAVMMIHMLQSSFINNNVALPIFYL